MEKREILLLIIKVSTPFVAIYVLLIFVLSLLVYGGYFSSHPIKERENSRKKTYEYKSLHFYPETMESLYGRATIFRDLKDDEFIFSRNEEEGQISLISNFGMDEFYCTGICSCDESEKRSTSVASTTVTRGIGYLVASISSIVAYQKAKDYFKDECEERLDDECPSNAIKSEVEGCEQAESPNFVLVSEEEEIEEGKNGEEYSFNCRGECLYNQFVYETLMQRLYRHNGDPANPLLKRHVDFLDGKRDFCESLRVSNPVKVKATKLAKAVLIVRSKFMKETLEPFCLNQSPMEEEPYMEYLYPSWHWEGKEKVGAWCQARDNTYDDVRIKCRRTTN